MDMKRIINLETGATIWRGDAYLVDGQPATVEPPLYLLTEVERPDPGYNEATHRLVGIPAHADLETGEWVTISRVAVALTADEIAENAAIAARKTWGNAADFLAEFSIPELAAVSLSTDPTVAALRLLLLAWSSDVWSDDPRIVGGLAALVASGIIDEARAAAITTKN